MKTDTPETDAITQPGDWTHCELPRRLELERNRYRTALEEMLRRSYNETELRLIARNALASESKREAAGLADEKPDGQAENDEAEARR